jgi:hypothetical protein
MQTVMFGEDFYRRLTAIRSRRLDILCQGHHGVRCQLVDLVAELSELFQLKCLSPALEARPHLNGNNPSIPRI